MEEQNGPRMENVGKTEKAEDRTETKGEKVSEEQRHEEEIRQAAKAEVGAGQVVPGSGRRGKPRRMAHMVSARLDGELVGKLRVVAKERNVTLSDLLREGAELIVEYEYAGAQPRVSFKVTGAQDARRTQASGRDLVAH